MCKPRVADSNGKKLIRRKKTKKKALSTGIRTNASLAARPLLNGAQEEGRRAGGSSDDDDADDGGDDSWVPDEEEEEEVEYEESEGEFHSEFFFLLNLLLENIFCLWVDSAFLLLGGDGKT